jgi:hypothetical protein
VPVPAVTDTLDRAVGPARVLFRPARGGEATQGGVSQLAQQRALADRRSAARRLEQQLRREARKKAARERTVLGGLPRAGLG